MNERPIVRGSLDFAPDYLAWISLRHFLSADQLRDLAAVAVVKTTGGRLQLGDLFDQELSGTGAAATWTLAPRPVADELSRFLQMHIRALAWANDADISPPRPDDDVDEPLTAAIALYDATRLGGMDLQNRPAAFETLRLPADSSARVFAQALSGSAKLLADPQSLDRAAVVTLWADDLSPSLAVAALKHLGDLYADVDEWHGALSLYETARSRLDSIPSDHRGDFSVAMEDIILQSIAAAARVLSGPVVAANWLRPALSGEPGAARRLLALNGSHDALAASISTDIYEHVADLRTMVMLPPQLLGSQNIELAVGNWLNGKYPSAYQKFWSVLRRQIALGSSEESRETKAVYARAVFDQIEEEQGGRKTTSDFGFAVGLLIESGHSATAKRLNFDQDVVRGHLTPEVLRNAIARACRHSGVRLERLRVLFELFAHWLQELDESQAPLAGEMLRVIVMHSAASEASSNRSLNLAGRGLEILGEVARVRPEYRRLVASDVAALCQSKIASDDWWTARREALKLAELYADVWSKESFGGVIDATIGLLTKLEAGGSSPLVRPAMDLLTSEAVTSLVRQDQRRSTRLFSTILRFGLSQARESVHLLFNLSDLQADLVLDGPDREALAGVVATAKERAADKTLSNSGDYINALLAAGSRVGPGTTEEALNALGAVLRSPAEGHRAASFAYAYNPVLYLARRRDRIGESSGLTEGTFQSALDELGAALVVAWDSILAQPLLLRGLSIPPETRPNTTLVHNWGVATREFAKCVGQRGSLLERLALAEAHPELAHEIRRARVFWFDQDAPDLSEIRGEPTDIFYGAIGHRLSLYWQMPESQRGPLLFSLIERCVTAGPNLLDAAVWTAALHAGIDGQIGRAELRDYVARADAREDMRRALMSLVYELRRRDELPEW